MAAPRYRFTARPAHETSDPFPLAPDAAQREVVAHRRGPLLVRGGPGTGKTVTLIEAAAARVASGVAPSDVLVLGFGRRAAADLRRRISARLDVTGAEVPVYSFQAYAFAILRRGAAARDRPPPRLLKGPEQDVVIRDLLASEAVTWPESIRPALGTRAFVAQLRDLLLRAAERGVSAPRLAELGRRHDRPEWIAAAEFLSKYVDVLALSSLTGGGAYDTAEIVRAAAAELAETGDLIRRPAHVFVDDLQDTDPAQWELLRLLVGGGGNLTAFGDADSATFGFRGGDPVIMRDFCDRFPTAAGDPPPSVDLTTCHRAAAAPVRVAAHVAARLRGTDRH
ncbi:MAG: UvrD-helicase domain-containing protein, partial [Stackebrandtia sp.]